MTLDDILEFLRVHVGAAVGAGGLGTVATTLYMQWRQRRSEAAKTALDEVSAVDALQDLVRDMAAQLKEAQSEILAQRANALRLESKVLMLDAEVLQLGMAKDTAMLKLDAAMTEIGDLKARLDECEQFRRGLPGGGL